MAEAHLRPGWLREEIEAAAAEIARQPKWLQELSRAWVRSINAKRDPCRCPRRCDEAQTCVGGCVYREPRDG